MTWQVISGVTVDGLDRLLLEVRTTPAETVPEGQDRRSWDTATPISALFSCHTCAEKLLYYTKKK